MALATIARPTTCTEASCQNATSHVDTCECSCAGVDHGLNHRARHQAARDRITARAARLGDPFLGAANTDDEDPF